MDLACKEYAATFFRDLPNRSVGCREHAYRRALLAYGNQFMGLMSRYCGGRFPHVPNRELLAKGLPVQEIYEVLESHLKLPIVGFLSPLNLGVGLLEYGNLDKNPELLEDVDWLLSPQRFERTHRRRHDTFPDTPYLPARYGRKPIQTRKPVRVSGGWGTLGWADLDSSKMEIEDMYSLLRLRDTRRDKETREFVASTAYEFLRLQVSWLTPERLGPLLRVLPIEQAREVLDSSKAISRERKAVLVCHPDVTPEEMRRSLVVLSSFGAFGGLLARVGRPITYGDVQDVSAKVLFRLLELAPNEVTAELRKDPRLPGMLVDLPSEQYAGLLSIRKDCPHRSPWTGGGDSYGEIVGHPRNEPDWCEKMKPLVEHYVRVRVWRDELMRLASPDTAFCALLVANHHKYPKQTPSEQNYALERALGSVPNRDELFEHLEQMPPYVLDKFDLNTQQWWLTSTSPT